MTRHPPKRVALIALALALGACRYSARVELRGTAPLSLDMNGQTVALAAQSPLVLLGTVQSVEPVGPVVRTADARDYKVRLHRISFAVEAALRGGVRSGRIDVYAYQWAESYVLNGKNIDDSTPRGRRIYFLAVDGGRFRCFQDVYRSYIEVQSGRHPDLVIPGRSPLLETIAEILLTSGQGVDPEAFGDGYLSGAISLAKASIGQTRTLVLVKPLLASPDELIREWACVLISDYFQGQDSCLDGLIKRPDLPVPIRARAEAALGFRKQRLENLRYWLAKDPMEWLRSDSGSDDPAKLLDSLRVLTTHRNQDVRKLACNFMARRFPDEYTRDCGRAPDP